MAEHDHQRQIQNMDQLTLGLSRIAASYNRDVHYAEEEPETFGAGHFVLYLRGDRTSRWAIEEQYADTDWSDPDRVPTSWTWQEQHLRRLPDGGSNWVPVAEGEIASDDVAQLVERAESWARNARATRLRQGFFAGTGRDAPGSRFSPPHLGL